MKIQQVETITELGEWLAVHMPSAVLDERGGEIVILTGLSLSMGGYLEPREGGGRVMVICGDCLYPIATCNCGRGRE